MVGPRMFLRELTCSLTRQQHVRTNSSLIEDIHYTVSCTINKAMMDTYDFWRIVLAALLAISVRKRLVSSASVPVRGSTLSIV